MKYLLMYCHYDVDNYRGHRVEHLKAQTKDEAKVEAKTFLDGLWGKMQFEFRIVEVGYDSGPRLWDTREPIRPYHKTEIDYTIAEYWDNELT